jgi:hypothetical protein
MPHAPALTAHAVVFRANSLPPGRKPLSPLLVDDQICPPVRTTLDVDALVRAITQVCSPASSFVLGVALPVDGGFVAPYGLPSAPSASGWVSLIGYHCE